MMSSYVAHHEVVLSPSVPSPLQARRQKKQSLQSPLRVVTPRSCPTSPALALGSSVVVPPTPAIKLLVDPISTSPFTTLSHHHILVIYSEDERYRFELRLKDRFVLPLDDGSDMDRIRKNNHEDDLSVTLGKQTPEGQLCTINLTNIQVTVGAPFDIKVFQMDKTLGHHVDISALTLVPPSTCTIEYVREQSRVVLTFCMKHDQAVEKMHQASYPIAATEPFIHQELLAVF